MYIVTTEFIRPSEDIPYYIDTNPVLKSEFLEFISAVGEVLITSMDTVNSGTQQITTVIYPDEDTFNYFMVFFNSTFPTFFEDRDLYCSTNNITITRTAETI